MVAGYVRSRTAQAVTPVIQPVVRQSPVPVPVVIVHLGKIIGLPVLVTVVDLNLVTELKVSASRVNGLAPHYTARPVAVVGRTGIITFLDTAA